MPPLTDLPEPESTPVRAPRRNVVRLEDLTDEDVFRALIDSGYLDAEEHRIFSRGFDRILGKKEIPGHEKKRARERFEKMGLDADEVAQRAWKGQAMRTVAPFDDSALGPKAIKPPRRR